MDVDPALRSILAAYSEELRTLTVNSKPIINHLTIVAGENLYAHNEIVALICERVSSAPITMMLPPLYLLDSIAKNIGGAYIPAIGARLEPLFCESFERAPATIRSSLKHLMKTWEAVFHPDLYVRLQAHVTHIQNTIPPPPMPDARRTAIHVNPNFRGAPPSVQSRPPVPPAANYNAYRQTRAPPRASLSPERGRDARTLPPRKGEREYRRSAEPAGYRRSSPRDDPLELFGTATPEKVRLEDVEILLQVVRYSVDSAVQSRGVPPRGQEKLRDQLIRLRDTHPNRRPPLVHRGPIPSETLKRIPIDLYEALEITRILPRAPPPVDIRSRQRPDSHHARAPPVSGHPHSHAPLPQHAPLPPRGSSSHSSGRRREEVGAHQAHHVDVPHTSEGKRPHPESPPPKVKQDSPCTWETLKETRPSLSEKLYASDIQCKMCGLRFPDKGPVDTHLDWHFRMNRRQKMKLKTAFSRQWYLTLEEWTAYAGHEVLQASAKPFFGEEGEEEEEEKKEVCTVKVDDSYNKRCPRCDEEFENKWDDTVEEWVYTDAVLLGSGVEKKVYHSICAKEDTPEEELPVRIKTEAGEKKEELVLEDAKMGELQNDVKMGNGDAATYEKGHEDPASSSSSSSASVSAVDLGKVKHEVVGNSIGEMSPPTVGEGEPLVDVKEETGGKKRPLESVEENSNPAKRPRLEPEIKSE